MRAWCTSCKFSRPYFDISTFTHLPSSRGQRRYKRFHDIDEETPEDGPAAANGLALERYGNVRPFTRSSVKPRVLFPKAAQPTTDDEEADTDIGSAAEEAHGPALAASTPTKPSLPTAAAPITPPTTTRAKKRVVSYAPEAVDDGLADDSLFTVKKAHRDGKGLGVTPFASWKRTKSAAGVERVAGKGKKRAAEEGGREDAQG